MIGFNQKQEAMRLWEILWESRAMIADFNCTDDQIAAACGEAAAKKDQVLRWYAALAFRVSRWALSGRYALCFHKADKVQRQPYDLLACLEVQPQEQAAFDEAMRGWQEPETDAAAPEPTLAAGGFRVLRPEYLAGLPEHHWPRARILYDRLLRIQPMRMLLARLMPLAEVLEDTAAPADRQELQLSVRVRKAVKEIVGAKGFRSPIPAWQERRSGAALDLQGNNFTILDRLMDNWDRKLDDNEQFVLPVATIQTARHMPSLLTAAIVHRLSANRSSGSRPQYVAIPGGHTLLGIYDKTDRSAPEKFFRNVTQTQTIRPRRLMRVRPYAGVQLLQVSDDMRTLMEKTPYCESDVGRPVAERPNVFCAKDEGGREVARLLEAEVRERELLDGKACLKAFVKDDPVSDAQMLRVITELRGVSEEFFRQKKVPEKAVSEIGSVTNASGNIRWKAMGRLMAYAARERMLFLPCPDQSVPPEITELLRALEEDGAQRAGFLAFASSLAQQPVKLNMRFDGAARDRVLCVLCTPESRFVRLIAWLEEADACQREGRLPQLREPDFTASELSEFSMYGLWKFIYSGTGMTRGVKPFSLKAEKAVTAQDVCFRLVCLWFRMLRCSADESLQICYCRSEPEQAAFRAETGAVRFADVLARSRQGDCVPDKLTPDRLRQLVAGLQSEQLEIKKTDRPTGRRGRKQEAGLAEIRASQQDEAEICFKISL